MYNKNGVEANENIEDIKENHSKTNNKNYNTYHKYKNGIEANVVIPKEYWFTIFDIDKVKESSMVDIFNFIDGFEWVSTYAYTKSNVYKVYLNIKIFFIEGPNQTFFESAESINSNHDR